MADSKVAIPGIEISSAELFRTRPAKNATGFAPAGKVNTHQWGANHSIYMGQGMEFAESRIYQPGDDVKNIDWRVTARTGQPHTKLYQEERERPVQILLDLRSMMQFGTRKRFKSHMAAEIAAKLAWIGHDGGDRVGGLISHRQGIADFKASRTRHSVLRFLDCIAHNTEFEQPVGEEVALSSSIRRLHQHSRSGGLVFLISDFIDFDEECERELKKISARCHVTLIHVWDPFDARLPSSGGRLSDGEDVLSLNTLSADTENTYKKAFEQRHSRLHDLCLQQRMVMHSIETEASLTSLFTPTSNRCNRRAG